MKHLIHSKAFNAQRSNVQLISTTRTDVRRTGVKRKGVKTALIMLLTCALVLPSGLSMALTQAEPANETILYGVLEASGTMESSYLVTVSEQDDQTTYEQTILTNEQLPWHFSFDYQLDGKSISQQELAGKHGELSLSIQVDENKESPTQAFAEYGLQVVISMPADRVKNIHAGDGTVVYKGSDRQIIYTLLPGESHAIELSCDVTEFEMSPILITAMPLSLPIDVTNTKETRAQLTELKTATESIETGSASLLKGSGELATAINQLKKGATAMKAALDQSLSKNAEVETLLASNQSTMTQLSQQASAMEQQLAQMPAESSGALKAQYEQTRQLMALLKANQQVISAQRDGLSSLSGGIDELVKGLNALSSGASKLNTGLKELNSGATTLTSSVTSSEAKFEGLFTQMERLDKTQTRITTEPSQYVLRTPAVHMIQSELAQNTGTSAEDKSEKTSIWSRLLKLFGISL